MKRQHDNPTHITLCIVEISCRQHGSHKLIVGGLDEMAEMAARIVKDRLSTVGRTAELTVKRIALEDAYTMMDLGGINYDDLPY